MAKVITTTTTFTDSDDNDHIITMHAIHGYTLVHRAIPAENRATWTVRSPSNLPWITEASAPMAEAPTYGVNLSVRGTQGTVDARVYAALVTTAADVADVFNRIAKGN